MKTFFKVTAAALIFVAGTMARAQSAEAPPMEPPYTNDSEFDAVIGEDPMATSQPLPATPGLQEPEIPTSDPLPVAQPQSTPSSNNYEATYNRGYKKGEKLEKGVKLIRHPDAKKGLLRIEQDGTYIYKVKSAPKSRSGIVRFGLMNPPNIQSADGTTDFKQMYSSSDIFTLLADYEWQPFSKYGKLGLQVGGGFSTTSGKGRFLSTGAEALEKYDFIILPLNAGVIYRFEYMSRQWVAPYISGGGSYIAVAELRDDGRSSLTGTPAAYGAGGLMFNITAFDRDIAFNLDSEYGIGNLWLVAEYRFQKSFSEDLDFTGGIMSFGISADF